MPNDVRCDLRFGACPAETLEAIFGHASETAISGNSAMPIPSETHCLIASTPENSMVLAGRVVYPLD
ncbi:MAG: hypothetical protein JOZ08_20500 [Verrucomicrobia bacterium]|nr:hypothetical protein [Verrucomicrobiota bacterium]